MTIIFTGGGTLGPVTPLIATIEALTLKRPEVRIEWIGTRTGVERAFVTAAGIPYRAIAAGKLRRYLDLRTLLDPFLVGIGFLQSLFLFLSHRPVAVVTTGAFVAVPVVWAAHLLRIPIVLHQLDVEVGLANRISCRCSTVDTVSFDESIAEFERRGKRAARIGAPVRRAVAELTDPMKRENARLRARARWGFDVRPTVLVLGGGTGAQELNDRIGRTIGELAPHVNVLHLTGRGKQGALENRPGYVVVDFLGPEMAEAYAVADLAVTRAGLGTLSELCTAGVPSLVIPLPGHQERNAALMERAGAGIALARTIRDREFVETVKRVALDRDRRAQMTRACAELFPPHAAERLADIIIEVAERKDAHSPRQ